MNYHQLNSNINGSIRGNNYELVNIDVNTQYNLTVSDINGDNVISLQQLHVHFFMLSSNRSGGQKNIFVVTIIHMINVFKAGILKPHL